MDPSASDLLRILDVEELEKNYFRGFNPDERWGRIFGGQVLGQALMAAGKTVSDDRLVHSLQSYFLLAGDPEVPVMFEVDRIRDGRSFTTRRVRAFQHGEAIFALSASFHVPEEGPEHQVPMPGFPSPDEATGDGPFGGASRDWFKPFEIRWVDVADDEAIPRQAMWFRFAGNLADDHLVHASVLAYSSDIGLVTVIAQRHWDRPFTDKLMVASLDHAIWFHRPFRMDEWLLYTRTSPSASGARGLALGTIHRADGTHAASVAQEGLVRPRR